jgi:predicted ATP-grasp superfamily ATP-dependent carboligase
LTPSLKGASLVLNQGPGRFRFKEEATRPDASNDSEILIVGASARAASWSAVRAGFSPRAVDLFGDRDLQRVAQSRQVDLGVYPDGLADAAESWPACPWLYTGPLENRPDLIERLARRGTLLGNTAETVRALRDPSLVSQALRCARLVAPEVRLAGSAGLPRDGSWLRKPLASAGGIGIEPFGPGPGAGPTGEVGYYYQQRVDGEALSAVFVGGQASPVLVGITKQLLGRQGAEFAYRGNVGPWPVPQEVAHRVAAVGNCLASRFRLVGLFGIDFQLPPEGDPWTIEVNPRYSASVEVLELALGRALLAYHVAACQGRPGCLEKPATTGQRLVAKEVLFARRTLRFDDLYGPFNTADPAHPFRVPEVADIPCAGQEINPGEPVLSIFAEGTTPATAMRNLASLKVDWERRLRL